MLVVFEAMSRRGAAVVNDDVLYRFRLRLFSLAQELGNVRAACRTMGVHPSTYYRWRGGDEASRGRRARGSVSLNRPDLALVTGEDAETCPT